VRFEAIYVGPSTLRGGMKGIPRAQRGNATLNDRVRIVLRSWSGEEFAPDDPRMVSINPAASDEFLEDFQRALAADDAYDERHGLA
jgi:hypothetical protein